MSITVETIISIDDDIWLDKYGASKLQSIADKVCKASIMAAGIDKKLEDINARLDTELDTDTNSQKKEKQISRLEISVLLCNDRKIQELNRKYRNLDKPTNVLSFPLISVNLTKDGDTLANLADSNAFEIYDKTLTLGDIAISHDRIKEEANQQNKGFESHFIHMLVHAALHLLGYDHIDESDADIMEKLEIEILKGFKIDNPYD